MKGKAVDRLEARLFGLGLIVTGVGVGLSVTGVFGRPDADAVIGTGIGWGLFAVTWGLVVGLMFVLESMKDGESSI